MTSSSNKTRQHRGVFNDQLQHELKTLLNTNARRQSPTNNAPRLMDSVLPHLNFIGEEGVDHLNVSRHSRMDLGKLLAMESPLNVTIPGLGSFASIAGLWYFLSNPTDTNYIKLPGSAVYAYGKKCPKHPKTEGRARLVIAYALWLLVQEHPQIAQALRELPVKFTIDCYTVKSRGMEKPELSRVTYSAWYAYAISQIRDALVHDREFPDFSRLSFLAKPPKNIYEADEYVKMINMFFERAIVPFMERKEEPVAYEADAGDDQAETVSTDLQNVTDTSGDLVDESEVVVPQATALPVSEQQPQPVSTAPQAVNVTANAVQNSAATESVEQA